MTDLAESSISRDSSAAPAAVRPLRRWAQALLWPFAVVLPLVAIIIELSTRMCAEELFDPLPTAFHVVLVFVVPLANLAALLVLRRAPNAGGSNVRLWRFVQFANGLAIGVAAYYALVFAPLTPISVLFVVFYGLGLLSLAPLINVICGLGLWRALRRRAPVRSPGNWWGLLASFAVLLALAAPPAMTRFAMVRAVEGTGEQRVRALRLLRSVGDRDILLRACYTRGGQVGDLASALLGAEHVSPTLARDLYYRVTGDPFNSVPPPRLQSFRGENVEQFWDFEQGSAEVGGVLKGLSLAASRLDGSLDGDAALGYLEWTLEFRNDAGVAREARTVIALPPGGVVTRATLWIAGEEREAAFGGRGAVRAAYEKVVRVQQRDPLLVTTAGPDRVLVQCFPVPVGGTMKVRIGVTVPLLVETASRARLLLPHFVERNFAVAPELRHALWVDSDAGLAALDEDGAVEEDAPAAAARPALVAERSAAASTVRGLLDDKALARRSIVADRRADVMTSWASDPQEPAFDVVETLVAAPARPLGRVVVVLDGSRALAGEADALREVLSNVQATPRGGLAPSIVLAGDDIVDLKPSEVTRGRFVGGTDNVGALVTAWDGVARDPGALVVWVHGPQPVALSRGDELMQRCARRPDGPRLVALAATPGPNRVLDALDGCPWAEVAARRGTLAADLRALLAGGSPSGTTLVPRLERVPAGTRRDGAEKTSAHLVRLWARDETLRLAAMASPGRGPSDFAVRYSLVTPWSGAVVLETVQEMEAEGLTPGSPQDVPTIPEPSLVVLMVVGAALLALMQRSRWRALWRGNAV